VGALGEVLGQAEEDNTHELDLVGDIEITAGEVEGGSEIGR
jgi:hypothetical protein